MYNNTILICLYNKNIEESQTIQSLIRSSELIGDFKIFIWDNSLVKLESESLDLLNQSFKKLKYVHTPENVVLSKIYNSAIEEQFDSNSYLILFDDDSEIPPTFFIKLKEEIQRNPLINLFLPQIYSDSILVSPAKDYLIRTKLIKYLEPGILDSKWITAINSGMVVSNRVFIDGFKYDDKLNFYGTDNYFMYHFSKKYKELIVLDVTIDHNLSFNDSKNISNKIRIFKEIKRANKIIYSQNKNEKRLVMFNNFIVSLKLSLKYKTLAFFK